MCRELGIVLGVAALRLVLRLSVLAVGLVAPLLDAEAMVEQVALLGAFSPSRVASAWALKASGSSRFSEGQRSRSSRL